MNFFVNSVLLCEREQGYGWELERETEAEVSEDADKEYLHWHLIWNDDYAGGEKPEEAGLRMTPEGPSPLKGEAPRATAAGGGRGI